MAKEKTAEPAETNTELKSELLHALFVLRSLNFHKFGHMKFGLGGRWHRGTGGHRAGHTSGCGHSHAHGSDLNMPGFALLKQLQMREERGESGGAWLSEMREYLQVSKAAVSQMLGSLESRGLITRETDPENRRTIIVKLTKEGYETIEQFESGFNRYIGMMVERFGEKDTREIIRLIYKFAGIIEEIQDDPETEI